MSSVDIEPDHGSHYLVVDGVRVARFNEVEKADAARSLWIEEMAAEHERQAYRFACESKKNVLEYVRSQLDQ
jgi:hypothetical protein